MMEGADVRPPPLTPYRGTPTQRGAEAPSGRVFFIWSTRRGKGEKTPRSGLKTGQRPVFFAFDLGHYLKIRPDTSKARWPSWGKRSATGRDGNR